MSDAEIPALESYRQLPTEGDIVLRVGDALVRFTARSEDGTTVGWTVTTADDGYEGFLRHTSDTVWLDDGAQPVHAYSFRYRGPEGSTGPTFEFGMPVDVSVEEFGRIFFGVNS